MKPKIVFKLAVDLVMTAYNLTDNAIHEILGIDGGPDARRAHVCLAT